ncbi:MAG: LytTR family DNA-binding domain-containing protein, partial [Chthoniobacterales bacterium]
EVDHGGRTGLVRQTLENFLAGPAGASFTQINRGQAVRLSAVRSYRGGVARGLTLRLADGRELAVSRRRANDVNAAVRASGHPRTSEG